MTVPRLREALLAEGGTLGEAVARSACLDAIPTGAAAAETTLPGATDADAAPGPPQLAAGGPRAAGRAADYELLLEMILEGSRLHYGAPRLVHVEDPDLALLLGDQLYALGLSRLAALGDLDAVGELADLISLVAQAHAAGDGALAEAVWQAGAVAIGWGASPEHEAAKALARAGDGRAAGALRCAGARSSRGRRERVS